MYNLGQKVAVFDGGRVLILKQSDYNKFGAGKWDLPGGKVEDGEELESAIKRELREETGLSIGDLSPGVFFTFKTETSENWLILVYRANYDGATIVLSDEHTEFKWVDMKEIDRMPFKRAGMPFVIRKAFGPVV